MTDEENGRLVAWVAGHRGELLELVRELIACKTDSQSEGNPEFGPEAIRCRDLVASALDGLPIDVERCVAGGGYPALAARLPGTGAPGSRSIALNGHIDVVAPGDPDHWTSDPWIATARDGRLYGRGAADMKAGVAALIFALKALDGVGIEPAGDVWLHIVSDEEVVGDSTRELVSRLPRVDAVIDAEPTGLQLMPVEGGLIHVRVEVEGVEAHAGNRWTHVRAGAPARGVSAVDKLLHLVGALRALEQQWAKKPVHPLLPPGFATIMPGIIVGGPGGGADGRLHVFTNAGTVPNYASVELNVWYMPSDTFEDVRDEIERCLHHACQLDPWLAEHPPRITWKLDNIFFPPVNTPLDHPILSALENAVARVGRSPTTIGFTAASEVAWYAEHGIGGTLFGPGAIEQAHGVDEYVPIDEIVDAAAAVAIAIATFTGGD